MAKTSRREFLKNAALTGAALTSIPTILGTSQAAVSAAAKIDKSRVVVTSDELVFKQNEPINQQLLNKMVDRTVAKLMNVSKPADAWKKLFSPKDVVGIKVNCLFGLTVSTHPEVAYAIANGLKQAGVKEENIIIWDRATGDLIKSGYTPNKSGKGIQVIGEDGDWGKDVEQGSFKGKISKILSEKVTAFVNVPILKTHGLAGMSGCLKNHYGSMDNPGQQHGNNCNPMMADFSAIPVVKKKTRLCVMDALRPQYNGGPSAKPDSQFNLYTIMASLDPVALDAHGLSILQEKRISAGVGAIDSKVTAWLASAEERGVGVCNPEKIEIVRV